MVGIIKNVKDNYSECILLKGVSNINVKINDIYGTIKNYENGYFIIDDVSNYDVININDIVYTSDINSNKIPIKIGYVYKIEYEEINKKILVKSDVDFNNINYLYVIGE